MIILGNKYPLSDADNDILQSKSIPICEIQLINDFELLTNQIKESIALKDHKVIVLNIEKNISVELIGYLEELDYDGIKFITYAAFVKKYLDRCFIEFNPKNHMILNNIKHDTKKKILKRFFDFSFALFAIILLSPVFIIIAIWIKLRSPEGSIFFTQQRLGLNGRFFRVYKFRTMVPNAEKILEDWLNTHPEIKEEYLEFRKLKNDPRIIPNIGNILRKTSLDELPQFFNVLLGDMSVVGPRPYIANEFYNHSKKYIQAITTVKPGITGYWQVTERNDTNFNNRVNMDIEYIRNNSFIGDLKIIFKTIEVMVFRRGA